MGMADTRMRDARSADQDATQSGNPNIAFNQPRMRDNRAMMPGTMKAPAPSFHRPMMNFNRGQRPTVAEMPAPQQQMPVQPIQSQFIRPYFRQ